MSFIWRLLEAVGAKLESFGLTLWLAGANMENTQPVANNMDQDARAVLALYLSRGEGEAYISMLSNARLMITQGREDLDLTVLDLAEHFREMPKEHNELPFHAISIMLRRLAHNLHREYGSPDRDGRFLCLVSMEKRSVTKS